MLVAVTPGAELPPPPLLPPPLPLDDPHPAATSTALATDTAMASHRLQESAISSCSSRRVDYSPVPLDPLSISIRRPLAVSNTKLGPSAWQHKRNGAAPPPHPGGLCWRQRKSSTSAGNESTCRSSRAGWASAAPLSTAGSGRASCCSARSSLT